MRSHFFLQFSSPMCHKAKAAPVVLTSFPVSNSNDNSDDDDDEKHRTRSISPIAIDKKAEREREREEGKERHTPFIKFPFKEYLSIFIWNISECIAKTMATIYI